MYFYYMSFLNYHNNSYYFRNHPKSTSFIEYIYLKLHRFSSKYLSIKKLFRVVLELLKLINFQNMIKLLPNRIQYTYYNLQANYQ